MLLLYSYGYNHINTLLFRCFTIVVISVLCAACGGGGGDGQSKPASVSTSQNLPLQTSDATSADNTSSNPIQNECLSELETSRDYSRWIADFGFDKIISDTLSTHCAIPTVVNIATGDTAAMYDAIEAANTRGDGVIIQLAAGIYEALPVEYPPLNKSKPAPAPPISGRPVPPISTNITIRGAGKDQTVFKFLQPTSDAFFSVDTNSSLVLEDLTLDGDSPPSKSQHTGRAVRSSGILVVNRARIANFRNSLENSIFVVSRGIIYAEPETTIIIAASEIQNNFSFAASGAVYGAGAQLLVVDSIVSRNISRVGSGGGMMMLDGKSLVLGSSFIGNDVGGDDNFGGSGGALIPGHPATIIDSAFIGNHAGAGGRGFGGAISFIGPFLRSIPQPPDASYLLTVINSTFSQNSADSGGAIFVANADADIISSTITRNAAIPSSTDPRCCGPINGSGGGLFAALQLDQQPELLTTEVRMQNTILVRNKDVGGNAFCGGGIVSLGNNIIANGDVSNDGTLTPIPDDIALEITGDRLLPFVDPDCDIQTHPSDLISDEVVIGLLQDNGKPGGVYHPLITDSSAIAGANANACPKHDQLGQARFSNNRGDVQCDVGAVEGVNAIISPDIDQDGDVDRVDVGLVIDRSGTLAQGSNDPLDIDRDGRITAADVRKITLLCNRWNCATE